MNKQMLAGLIGGVAIATAGGVAGFAFLGGPSEVDPSAAQEAGMEHDSAEAALPAPADAAPAAVAHEQCWDEEVTVPAEPRDDKAIAGTAAGALIGGAIAKNLGDDSDLVTAAGAAAGAFAGRKAQREYQENNTTTTVERRCAPAEPR